MIHFAAAVISSNLFISEAIEKSHFHFKSAFASRKFKMGNRRAMISFSLMCGREVRAVDGQQELMNFPSSALEKLQTLFYPNVNLSYE